MSYQSMTRRVDDPDIQQQIEQAPEALAQAMRQIDEGLIRLERLAELAPKTSEGWLQRRIFVFLRETGMRDGRALMEAARWVEKIVSERDRSDIANL
ncbi:MAG: hypothetical protein AB7F35_00735 [Acetobacteraceae bacterium]